MLDPMQNDHTNLILLSGPVGVGKTSVAEELSGLLERDQIAHTFIDLDGLSKTYPRPDGDPFGEQMALRNLRDVWANARDLGVKILILARVIESREGAQRIAQAVGAADSQIIQLNARDETLLDRVRRRETGIGRAWHEDRALALSSQLRGSGLAHHEIETDAKTVAEIAREVRQVIKLNQTF